MSSSSSATATGSRSASPATPEAFDSLDPIAIHNDLDSWYLSSMQPPKSSQWDINSPEFMVPRKTEDDQMLHLDELIEQHAYDEYVVLLSSLRSQFICFTAPSHPLSMGTHRPSHTRPTSKILPILLRSPRRLTLDQATFSSHPVMAQY